MFFKSIIFSLFSWEDYRHIKMVISLRNSFFLGGIGNLPRIFSDVECVGFFTLPGEISAIILSFFCTMVSCIWQVGFLCRRDWEFYKWVIFQVEGKLTTGLTIVLATAIIVNEAGLLYPLGIYVWTDSQRRLVL